MSKNSESDNFFVSSIIVIKNFFWTLTRREHFLFLHFCYKCILKYQLRTMIYIFGFLNHRVIQVSHSFLDVAGIVWTRPKAFRIQNDHLYHKRL